MEVHEYLTRFEPPPPPDGLRERVLRSRRPRPLRILFAAAILLASAVTMIWVNASIDRRIDHALERGAGVAVRGRDTKDASRAIVHPFAVFESSPRVTATSWIQLRESLPGDRS